MRLSDEKTNEMKEVMRTYLNEEKGLARRVAAGEWKRDPGLAGRRRRNVFTIMNECGATLASEAGVV